jgi:hypothetical protein
MAMEKINEKGGEKQNNLIFHRNRAELKQVDSRDPNIFDNLNLENIIVKFYFNKN